MLYEHKLKVVTALENFHLNEEMGEEPSTSRAKEYDNTTIIQLFRTLRRRRQREAESEGRWILAYGKGSEVW